MKTGTVPLSALTQSGSLRLDAEFYLAPTKTIDLELQKAARTLRGAKTRIKKLNAQREKAVADAKTRGIEVPELKLDLGEP